MFIHSSLYTQQVLNFVLTTNDIIIFSSFFLWEFLIAIAIPQQYIRWCLHCYLQRIFEFSHLIIKIYTSKSDLFANCVEAI